MAGQTESQGGVEKDLEFKSELAQVCWLELTGPDTADFLQAQLTSDIDSLASDANTVEQNLVTTQLGAWCSPKGRVLCLFRVVRLDAERYALRMPTALVDTLVKRLRMFVLRCKVSVELAPWKTIGITLNGRTNSNSLPIEPGAGVLLSSGFAYAVEGDIPRWELVSFSADVDALSSELGLGPLPTEPSAVWRLYDIRARIPYVDESTTDRFVPQMLDLHTIGAVSFEKGCYPGQEIVARTQYRGTLKRRLASMIGSGEVANGEQPSPGLRIFADREASEAIAEVVLAEQAGDDWEMLAVIKSEATPPETLIVELGEKPILQQTGN